METIPIPCAGFEGRGLCLAAAGLFRPARVMIDGAAVARRCVLKNNAGESVKLEVKSRFIDPVPTVEIEGKAVELVPALTWYEYAWLACPIILAYFGGALGGLFGAAAAYSNARIFRGGRSAVAKYVATGLISAASVILYFAVAIVAYEGAHVFLAPTTADDYMLRAAANYKLGKTDETLEALTQALKQKPDMATAYSLRGAVYLSKGNPDEAAADLTQALTFGDKTADLYVARANALFLKNDYQGALSDLNEAVRLEPKNNCYALRGIIEQKLNDPRSAVADYDRALALPMENSLASKVKVLREKAVKDLPAP